ncbi:uncharacterized protein LOC133183322 [Saccostrea echinata]|uniref:uncharacterized protein LOC133183322 n=1 Tax=Saccostrea echinata TaxID=191078 RepID=UPI002A80DF0F|nr:uncharacterized protein LOC133183322 [Saccostrea echinata]XP_061174266.1 uncharacterized protein LOC133183322 [Saccostrea echinata]XP_061174267.1 uncharacterized protein LOC133183322 [Saccostrea echinata]
MNIYFGLPHLLFWQAHHFCNWISAVPLDKPTTTSDSLENSLQTRGDLSSIKHIENPRSINGNYSAGVTIATLETHSLLTQANDAKRKPKVSNELSMTEFMDSTDDKNESVPVVNKYGNPKEINIQTSIKTPSDKLLDRILRDEKSTTEIYNEINFLQTTKSEKEIISSENKPTVENGTLVSEHHPLNVSLHSNESVSTAMNTTIILTINSTTEGTTMKTPTNTTNKVSTAGNGVKENMTTMQTTTSVKQTTHEYHQLRLFTGFAENVPIRPRYPQHNNHHLNLVPMEDSPFGNLLWKDKKYLMSVLVPISIGVVGAACIIGMAYIARYCYRNERQIQMMKERITQTQETRTDNIVLLDDSDDEF